MSDTPLTDEFVKKHHTDWPMWDWNDHASAYLEWAKELEHENAELRKALVLVKLYSPLHKDDRWASLIAEQALNNTVDNKNEAQW